MNDQQKEEAEVLQSIFEGTDALSVQGTRVDVSWCDGLCVLEQISVKVDAPSPVHLVVNLRSTSDTVALAGACIILFLKSRERSVAQCVWEPCVVALCSYPSSAHPTRMHARSRVPAVSGSSSTYEL